MLTDEERKARARESRKRWLEKNHEYQLELTRKWKKKHPEKIREYQRRYCERHPERERARKRRYLEKHPDYLKGYRYATGSFLYAPRAWTQEEDELILSKPFTDREIGELICRSGAAIATRRHKLKTA